MKNNAKANVLKAISVGLSASMAMAPMTAMAADAPAVESVPVSLTGSTAAQSEATAAAVATATAESKVNTVDSAVENATFEDASTKKALNDLSDVMDAKTDAAKTNVSDAQDDLADADAASDDYEDAAANADGKVAAMDKVADELGKNISNTKNLIDESMEKLAAPKTITELAETMESIEKAVEQSESAYATAKANYSTLKGEYDTYKAQVEQAKADYEAAVAEAEADLDSAKTNLFAAKAKADELEKKVKDAKDAYDAAVADFDAKSAAVATAQQNLEDAKSLVDASTEAAMKAIIAAWDNNKFANGSSIDWTKASNVFVAVLENYYCDQIAAAKGYESVVLSNARVDGFIKGVNPATGATDDKYNCFELIATKADGTKESLMVNYKVKDGAIILYDKKTVEYVDQAEQYVVFGDNNKVAVSILPEDLADGLNNHSIVAVENGDGTTTYYYSDLADGVVSTSVVAKDETKAGVTAKDTGVVAREIIEIDNETAEWSVVDGKITRTIKGDVTTTTYTGATMTSWNNTWFDSENAAKDNTKYHVNYTGYGETRKETGNIIESLDITSRDVYKDSVADFGTFIGDKSTTSADVEAAAKDGFADKDIITNFAITSSVDNFGETKHATSGFDYATEDAARAAAAQDAAIGANDKLGAVVVTENKNYVDDSISSSTTFDSAAEAKAAGDAVALGAQDKDAVVTVNEKTVSVDSTKEVSKTDSSDYVYESEAEARKAAQDAALADGAKDAATVTVDSKVVTEVTNKNAVKAEVEYDTVFTSTLNLKDMKVTVDSDLNFFNDNYERPLVVEALYNAIKSQVEAQGYKLLTTLADLTKVQNSFLPSVGDMADAGWYKVTATLHGSVDVKYSAKSTASATVTDKKSVEAATNEAATKLATAVNDAANKAKSKFTSFNFGGKNTKVSTGKAVAQVNDKAVTKDSMKSSASFVNPTEKTTTKYSYNSAYTVDEKTTKDVTKYECTVDYKKYTGSTFAYDQAYQQYLNTTYSYAQDVQEFEKTQYQATAHYLAKNVVTENGAVISTTSYAADPLTYLNKIAHDVYVDDYYNNSEYGSNYKKATAAEKAEAAEHVVKFTNNDSYLDDTKAIIAAEKALADAEKELGDTGLAEKISETRTLLNTYADLLSKATEAKNAVKAAQDEVDALKLQVASMNIDEYVADADGLEGEATTATLADLKSKLADAENKLADAEDAYKNMQDAADEARDQYKKTANGIADGLKIAISNGEVTPEQIDVINTIVDGGIVAGGAAVNGGGVVIEDEETPLAVEEEIKDEATPKAAEKEQMSWWWLIIVALLGATGITLYEKNKKKKAEVAEKVEK